MASFSRPTTSSPSQPVALKPFVHFRRIPCCGKKHLSESPSIAGGRQSQVPARDAARRGEVTSSRLFCWQGKEKVNPSGSDTPFIPMYSRKSEMQWTMWSKSWTSKAKRKSYHHSQSPAGSQPAQTAGDFNPLPGLSEHSNHSQDFEQGRTWLSCTVGGEQPQKAPFHPIPHHSVVKSRHYFCLAGPRRGGGQQGGDMGSQSLCKGSPQPSGPVCWRYTQSPSTAWSDCKTLSKHVSGDVSLLVLWFPYLGNGDGDYLPLWSVWDSGRFSHVWE